MSDAGPPPDANGTAASGRNVACAPLAFRPPSKRADALYEPGLRPARLDVLGGSAAAPAASMGVL
jgi:hypothetical protein